MKNVSMVDGCFDPIHPGHILYFQKAFELGDPVFCNVTGDDYLNKKHPPLLNHHKRCLIIDSIKFIDFTYQSHQKTATVLDILKPKRFIKGKDWYYKGISEDEKMVCEKNNTEIVFLDTIIDSSSEILKNYTNEK